jgi:hypothetical protein
MVTWQEDAQPPAALPSSGRSEPDVEWIRRLEAYRARMTRHGLVHAQRLRGIDARRPSGRRPRGDERNAQQTEHRHAETPPADGLDLEQERAHEPREVSEAALLSPLGAPSGTGFGDERLPNDIGVQRPIRGERGRCFMRQLQQSPVSRVREDGVRLGKR